MTVSWSVAALYLVLLVWLLREVRWAWCQERRRGLRRLSAEELAGMEDEDDEEGGEPDERAGEEHAPAAAPDLGPSPEVVADIEEILRESDG